jgi:hypothetical protein
MARLTRPAFARKEPLRLAYSFEDRTRKLDRYKDYRTEWTQFWIQTPRNSPN